MLLEHQLLIYVLGAPQVVIWSSVGVALLCRHVLRRMASAQTKTNNPAIPKTNSNSPAMPKDDNPTPVKTIQQLLDPTATPFGGKYGQDNDSYVFDESRVTISN